MRDAPFIVLEGIDGAGTTTQTGLLVAALREAGLKAHGTREPSDGRIHMPETKHTPRWAELALLFSADRLDHLSAEVLPRLAQGECVVSDRYDHSTIAYQSAFARDEGSIGWLRDTTDDHFIDQGGIDTGAE